MDVFEQHGPDLLIRVKVVPGSSRDQVSGVLGDRLKVRVSAPPEGGQANKSVCRLLAEALGLRFRDVTVESGTASPEKLVRVRAITAEEARRRIL